VEGSRQRETGCWCLVVGSQLVGEAAAGRRARPLTFFAVAHVRTKVNRSHKSHPALRSTNPPSPRYNRQTDKIKKKNHSPLAVEHSTVPASLCVSIYSGSLTYLAHTWRTYSSQYVSNAVGSRAAMYFPGASTLSISEEEEDSPELPLAYSHSWPHEGSLSETALAARAAHAA
jgi:hypothetical protein